MTTLRPDNPANLIARLTEYAPDQAEAYKAGYDCGKNGANTTNCHFRLFRSTEMTRAWTRGKRDAETESE